MLAAAAACADPGGLSSFGIDLSQSSLSVTPGPYIAGLSYQATFEARDREGDPFTGAIPMEFDLVGGSSAVTLTDIYPLGNGAYAAYLTATTAGTPGRLRLSIGGAGAGVLTDTTPISVFPGPASGFMTHAGASTQHIPMGGTSTITVTSRDAVGNVRTNGGDLITLSLGTSSPPGISLGDGTLSPAIDNGNGTYTSTFTGTDWGARQLRGTINGFELTSTMPGIVIEMPPPSLTVSTVVVRRSDLAVGDTTTATLELRDPNGRRVTWTGYIVTFTKDAGTSDGTFSGVTDRRDGSYTATFTATAAGTARAIGASIGPNAVTSAAPTITVH